jgi:hypothetical protein
VRGERGKEGMGCAWARGKTRREFKPKGSFFHLGNAFSFSQKIDYTCYDVYLNIIYYVNDYIYS